MRQNNLVLNQISELNNASTDTGKEFNIDVEINDGEPLPGSTMKLCPLIPPGNELVHNMCKFFFLCVFKWIFKIFMNVMRSHSLLQDFMVQ